MDPCNLQRHSQRSHWPELHHMVILPGKANSALYDLLERQAKRKEVSEEVETIIEEAVNTLIFQMAL